MVLVLTHSGLDVAHELGKQRCEQGWTCKTDVRECSSVGVNNCLDSVDVRILSVTIHGKAVVYTILTKMTRNTAKTEDSKESVIVIWFNNCTDIQDSLLILVVAFKIMK